MVTPAVGAPSNLPVGLPTHVVAETEVHAEQEVTEVQQTVVPKQSSAGQELETIAHRHRILISSDALAYILQKHPREIERTAFAEKLFGEARVSFPTEDGWVVLNLARLREMLNETESMPEAEPTEVSENMVGSLAEAIVMQNVPAAYNLIGQRPMVALAEASADLDALYRTKQGEDADVSELLVRESNAISAEQIRAAIHTLSTAIDGTYDSELEAVRIAVLKAVKDVSPEVTEKPVR